MESQTPAVKKRCVPCVEKKLRQALKESRAKIQQLRQSLRQSQERAHRLESRIMELEAMEWQHLGRHMLGEEDD